MDNLTYLFLLLVAFLLVFLLGNVVGRKSRPKGKTLQEMSEKELDRVKSQLIDECIRRDAERNAAEPFEEFKEDRRR